MAFDPIDHTGAWWYGERLSACGLVYAHSLVSYYIPFSNIRASISQVMRQCSQVPHSEQVVKLQF